MQNHRVFTAVAAFLFWLYCDPFAFAAAAGGIASTGPDLQFSVTPTVGTENLVGDWTTGGLAVTGGLTTTGAVGIGTSTPGVALDVNGGVRAGSDPTICTASNDGEVRYNKTSHSLEYCNSILWQVIATPATAVASGTTCGYSNTSMFPDNQYPCGGLDPLHSCPANYTRVTDGFTQYWCAHN